MGGGGGPVSAPGPKGRGGREGVNFHPGAAVRGINPPSKGGAFKTAGVPPNKRGFLQKRRPARPGKSSPHRGWRGSGFPGSRTAPSTHVLGHSLIGPKLQRQKKNTPRRASGRFGGNTPSTGGHSGPKKKQFFGGSYGELVLPFLMGRWSGRGPGLLNGRFQNVDGNESFFPGGPKLFPV